jgi:hypothetical protein
LVSTTRIGMPFFESPQLFEAFDLFQRRDRQHGEFE